MTSADLIATLEKAEGPSWMLDAIIHQSVTPTLADAVPCDSGWIVGGNHANPTKAPLYTASIDAALTLVPDGWAWEIKSSYWETDKRTAACLLKIEGRLRHALGATPAIALCIAALRARN